MSALDCMAASPQRVADPNAQQMADMIRAFWISQIVGTFAQLASPIISPAARFPPAAR